MKGQQLREIFAAVPHDDIGPALMLLAWFDEARVSFGFATFGRVPLFYYVIHIYLIHALAVVTAAGT
jgi:hypothetical protein